MRVLFDTHTLLWAALDEKRLSRRVRKLAEDLRTEVLVSDVSVWEMVLKLQLGKMKLPGGVSGFVADEFEKNRYEPLPIARRHVLKVEELPSLHRDPFDRLLIAQAIEEDLPIVTKDSQIELYGAVKTIW